MMSRLIWALPLCLMSTPVLAKEGSLFEFKGITAGSTVNAQLFSKCTSIDKTTTECYLKDKVIAGKERGSGPKIGLIDGQLAYVAYSFEEAEADTLLDMLFEKYGPDSTNDVGNWTAKASKISDLDQFSWRFSTGVLTVSFEKKSGRGRLTYTDTYRPTVKPVRPDF